MVCRMRDHRENMSVMHRCDAKLISGTGIGRGYWVHGITTPCYDGEKVAKALARRGIKLERIELQLSEGDN